MSQFHTTCIGGWTVAHETFTGMSRRYFTNPEDAQDYFDELVRLGKKPALYRN